MRHHQAGRISQAEGLYETILASDRRHAEAMALMGLIALQTGRAEAAAGLLARAIAIRPDMAQAQLNLGNALRALGRLDEALSRFEKAVELNPTFPGAYNNIGLALQELGRHAVSVPWFEKALRLDSAFADAHNGLGLALQHLGRLDEAVRRYEKALAAEPHFVEAHNNLGTALRMQGEVEGAVAAYERALALKPDFADALVNLGLVLGEAGRHGEAVESLEKALGARPGSSDLHALLGAALGNDGRRDEAIGHYEKAIELDPGSPESRIDLGVALYEQGDAAAALEQYEQALETDPDFSDAHRNRAITLLELGRNDEASGAFDEVLRLRHGGPWWNAGDFETALDAAAEPDGPLRASTFKLRDRLDQIEHLLAKGLIAPSFEEMARRYRVTLEEFERDHGVDGTDALTPEQAARIGAFYDRVVRHAPAPRIASGAVNDALDYAAIEESYLSSPISITTFDGILTPEALGALRAFCLETTICFGYSGARFVGSDLAAGFNCPLLYQIAEELKERLPGMLGGHELSNVWMYRHRNETVGVEAHTDQGAVTFNFWITPDEANLEPGRGGLLVYAREQPYDWDWNRINNQKYRPEVLAEINDFLAGAETLTIAYGGNRAVLFHSNLFHKSDNVRFREGYLNRRMNVTMLFGKRDA